MRILIIAGGFLPAQKYGGPVVSIDNLCTLLDDEFYVVARNHDLGEQKKLEGISQGWNIRSNCKVLYLQDSECKYKRFMEIFCEVSPDIVYLNSLFSATFIIPVLSICKRKKCPVLLAPRGQLCAGAMKKKYKKIPYIIYLRLSGLIKNVYFQSTSNEETAAITKYLHIKKDKIFFLTNVPSIPSKFCGGQEKKEGIGRFVFLSRIHPKKNLLLAIKCFEEVKGKVIFDIYGPIEDTEYWEKCQNEILKLPSNIKVSYGGLVSHEMVHQIFEKYDAFVFPTFSENYGHVIAESLIVGTSVIISDQTPWTDINDVGAGWAIPLGNIEKYEEALQTIVDMSQSEYDQLRKRCKNFCLKKVELNEIKDCYKRSFVSIVEGKK